MSMRPPAMPKMPDRNEVATMVPSTASISATDIGAFSLTLCMSRLPCNENLNYVALSPPFAEGAMRRLPYLNGIRAFEAAARCGSFAGAAVELSVTPAAVSRMVRLLEDRLGVGLFERSANRLALTAAGRAYRIGLSPILDALVQLTDQVKAQSS